MNDIRIDVQPGDYSVNSKGIAYKISKGETVDVFLVGSETSIRINYPKNMHPPAIVYTVDVNE